MCHLDMRIDRQTGQVDMGDNAIQGADTDSMENIIVKQPLVPQVSVIHHDDNGNPESSHLMPETGTNQQAIDDDEGIDDGFSWATVENMAHIAKVEKMDTILHKMHKVHSADEAIPRRSWNTIDNLPLTRIQSQHSLPYVGETSLGNDAKAKSDDFLQHCDYISVKNKCPSNSEIIELSTFKKGARTVKPPQTLCQGANFHFPNQSFPMPMETSLTFPLPTRIIRSPMATSSLPSATSQNSSQLELYPMETSFKYPWPTRIIRSPMEVNSFPRKIMKKRWSPLDTYTLPLTTTHLPCDSNHVPMEISPSPVITGRSYQKARHLPFETSPVSREMRRLPLETDPLPLARIPIHSAIGETSPPPELENSGIHIIAPQPDDWKWLFDKYDTSRDGAITVEKFRCFLEQAEFRISVGQHKLDLLEEKAAEDGRKSVTYQEIIAVVSSKRRRSFQVAVHWRDREVWSENDFHLKTEEERFFDRMVRRIAKEFLPEEGDRLYYADHYTCWPPPIFMPAVTLIEIGFFIYYSLEAGDLSVAGPVPVNSIFVYRPDKRAEIWRFLLYMFIHAGWVHLFFNMLVQLLVGVPLEMVHGSCRIGIVYMAGVLAGSLGISVFDKDAFLVGASGGVYALLAAHLANILLNYSEMELGILRLAAVFIIASADVGFAIWDRYTNNVTEPPVGYVSHLMGALAGLTIGLLVLKNFEQKLHAQVMWWVALGIYSICTLFAVLWNIFYY